MDAISFLVQGSAADPYHVTIQRDGPNLTARCTCPAGVVGQYCKHRFALLSGDASGVVSENAAAVSQVAGWLAGSDLEGALEHLALCEAALDAAKRELAQAKKAVAWAMKD